MAKARVAVLISGTGTNMAALLYAAKNGGRNQVFCEAA